MTSARAACAWAGPRRCRPSGSQELDLSPLARVVVPFISDDQAQDLRARLGAAFAAQGFTEAPERAASGSLQYDRRSALAEGLGTGPGRA